MKPSIFRLTWSVLILSLLFFTSCEKEFSQEGQNPIVITPPVTPDPDPEPEPEPEPEPDPEEVKFQDLKQLLISGNFQLRAFYSDVPIDYIENDNVVKAETDLWSYVIGYLKDDVNTFSENNSDLQIQQNAVKIPGNSDAILYRTYQVGKDDQGVYIEFLDYQYNSFTYRVEDVTENSFEVSVEWKDGIKLFSRFDRI